MLNVNTPHQHMQRPHLVVTAHFLSRPRHHVNRYTRLTRIPNWKAFLLRQTPTTYEANYSTSGITDHRNIKIFSSTLSMQFSSPINLYLHAPYSSTLTIAQSCIAYIPKTHLDFLIANTYQVTSSNSTNSKLASMSHIQRRIVPRVSSNIAIILNYDGCMALLICKFHNCTAWPRSYSNNNRYNSIPC